MKKRKPIHDNWATPKYLLDKIRAEFGEFYDPCPLNADFDGLAIDWPKDKTIFINPPYSRTLKEAFIKKAYHHSCVMRHALCVMLLPVSTSTAIFHDYILGKAEIRFLRGRVKFEGINSYGDLVNTKCGMHDSMLVIFRADSGRPNFI